MEATLDFVHDCEKHWGVKVNWLELDIGTKPVWQTKQVTYETASRNGEPFDKLINKKNRLPTLYQRTCTIELKINVINRFMRNKGYKEWYSALGLRYDEPRRVADSKNNSQKHVNIAPLYEAKVTNEDVLEYWSKSNFDLQLPSIDGKTVAGNCDLCFLKGTKSIINILREKPDLANWWIEKEKEKTFRGDRSYIKLVDLSKKDFDPGIDDTTYTCFCHD
jgi:3'-phosphoadenosine 5'-phosphosulfate sulfotransferase (PAPS reductase)/FAD synthetase